MRLQEKKLYIEKIKQDIEEILSMRGEDKVKNILEIVNKEDVKKIVMKDNQLMILSFACSIWAAEKAMDLKSTIFTKVFCLKDLESLYIDLKFFCRRFEYDVPEEHLLEGIKYIIKNNISGVALYSIVEVQLIKKRETILKIVRNLKVNRQMIVAVTMIQLALKKYENDEELIMEFADIYIMLQQWKQAYEILNRIERPSGEMKELILNLKEVINDESY